MDHLDGDYTSLADNQGNTAAREVWYRDVTDDDPPVLARPWFKDQRKEEISYYSGTGPEFDEDGRITGHTDQAVVIKDGVDLPAPITVKNEDGSLVGASWKDNWNRLPGTGEDGAKTEAERERYAYDTAGGFRLINPKGYAKVSTSRPVEIRGKRQDPSYKSIDPVKMYLAETSLVRGSVGALYTVSNLSLIHI